MREDPEGRTTETLIHYNHDNLTLSVFGTGDLIFLILHLNMLSLVLFAGMTLNNCAVFGSGPLCRESQPLCRDNKPFSKFMTSSLSLIL